MQHTAPMPQFSPCSGQINTTSGAPFASIFFAPLGDDLAGGEAPYGQALPSKPNRRCSKPLGEWLTASGIGMA